MWPIGTCNQIIDNCRQREKGSPRHQQYNSNLGNIYVPFWAKNTFYSLHKGIRQSHMNYLWDGVICRREANSLFAYAHRGLVKSASWTIIVWYNCVSSHYLHLRWRIIGLTIRTNDTEIWMWIYIFSLRKFRFKMRLLKRLFKRHDK